MRKRMNVGLKKACALLLVLVMVLGYIPSGVVDVQAVDIPENMDYTKEADPATVNAWTKYFAADSTEYAGGIWTDKSVFTDAGAYVEATAESDDALANTLAVDGDNFLVSLSAIASTKTIEGYSNIPTDTILILDVSASMSNDDYDDDVVNAANRAIQTLLSLNEHNRVGVVLYSGTATNSTDTRNTATLLLPLDRYTPGDAYTVGGVSYDEYLKYTTDGWWQNPSSSIAVGDRLLNSSGASVGSASRQFTSATFIQSGLYAAMNAFEEAETEVTGDVLQAGTVRMPVTVLMTDGEPTVGNTNYMAPTNQEFGNGSDSSVGLSFVTQLTAAYMKSQVESHYGRSSLFYTLGLSVGNLEAAESVLDPANETYTDEFWSEFLSANDGTVSWYDHYRNGSDQRDQFTVNKGSADTTDYSKYRYYVDQYFPASNAAGLNTAFQAIVDAITIQSMYYPTHVEGDDFNQGGFVEFRDYIGENMEVKDVKGVQLGDTLYTGENFALTVATGMGTVDNPTDAGNQLVWALIQRLNLQGTYEEQVAEARALLRNAWTHGQLACTYTGNAEDGYVVQSYSNYVGWYANAAGQYIGFWDGTEEAFASRPEGAVQAVKSYAMLGEVGHGHRATDMLYASIQVRTNIETGEEIVYGRLPASLIPLVQYNVSLDSGNPTTATTAELTTTMATPSRLIYEVGLDDSVDLLNLAGTANANKQTDGSYVFYTNQWDSGSEHDPSRHENTFVSFQPSDENERYVYHEDMPIYVKSGDDYVRYTGETVPSGEGYYRTYAVYTKTGSGDAAMITINYEPIPSDILTSGNLEYQDGYWIVKKGTIHLTEARAAVAKTDNVTGTLGYSEYPSVCNEGGYHLHAVLGNNGKLTIGAPEGIKLDKNVDTTLSADGTYNFVVAAENVNGAAENLACTVIREAADGTRTTDTTLTSFDNKGKLNVSVSTTELVYILVASGVTLTVEEVIPDSAEYRVASVNGDSTKTSAVVTVANGEIETVTFENTKVVGGDIVIGKTVNSTFADHRDAAKKTFAFTVSVTGLEADKEYVLVYSNGTTANFTADAAGNASLTVNLAHEQYVTVKELPVNAVVTVTETSQAEAGFTTTVATTQNATAVTSLTGSETVVAGTERYIHFTNTYKASESDPPVGLTIQGIKALNADVALTDESFSFEFILEQRVWDAESGDYAYVQVGDSRSVTITAEDLSSGAYEDTFGFTLENQKYSEPGIYTYRVSEVIPTEKAAGVVYDAIPAYFDVYVTDDGSGKLYVSDVKEGTKATVSVTKDENRTDAVRSAEVAVVFTNEYSVSGAAKVVINAEKLIEGISKAGFEFKLTEYTDNTFNTAVTNGEVIDTVSADGLAVFELVYDDANELGKHYYILEEVSGAVNAQYGEITYSEQKYEIIVDVTTINAQYAVTVSVDGKEVASSDNLSSSESDTSVAALTVSGVDGEGSDTVTITTTVEGGTIMYKLGEGEANQYTDPITVNDGVTLTAYVVVGEGESAATSETVTYIGGQGLQTMDNSSEDEQTTTDPTVASVTVSGITFTNTYEPNAVKLPIPISGTKTLTGGVEEQEFSFALYETGSDFTVAGNAVSVATATAKPDGVPVTFTFSNDMTFSEAKTYYYVAKEVSGSNAGVTYDQSYYKVTVTVTQDNTTGELSAQVSSIIKDDGTATGIAFTNTYKADDAEAALTVTKKLTGTLKLQANMFLFDLFELVDGKEVPVQTGVGNGANVNDEHYMADGTGYTTASVTFNAITYSAVGEHTYVIREQDGGRAGVSYAENSVYVKVVVTDNGEGQLTAEVGYYSDEACTNPVTPLFENIYQPMDLTEDVTITGTKTLTGKALLDGEFEFALYATDHYFSAGSEKLVDGPVENENGAFTLTISKDTINAVGGYRYVIKEVADSNNKNITYDPTVYYVLVEVTDSNGQLVSNVTIGTDCDEHGTITGTVSSVEFENSFTPDPGEVEISGEKVLVSDDMTLQGNDYTFELYATNEEYQITADPIATVKNDASGAFNFELKLEEGTHYFVLKEKVPVESDEDYNENMLYDTREYKFYVVMQRNAEPEVSLDGTVYHEDGTRYETGDFVFTNVEKDEIAKKDVALASKPDVSIDGQYVEPGSVLTYTIEYTNYTTEAVNVTITDTIPDYTAYAENSAKAHVSGHSGSIDIELVGNTLTWEIKDVAPGAVVAATFNVTVNDVEDVVISNEATVNGQNTNETHVHTDDENPGKDVFKAGTTVSIDGEQVVKDQILQYEIVYTNIGDETATVEVTDEIPDHTSYVENSAKTYVDGEPVSATISTGNGIVEWVIQNVPGWSTVKVTFQVKVDVEVGSDELIENQATVKVGENTATTNKVVNHTYEELPDKDVSKVENKTSVEIDGRQVNAGDTLTYTIDHINLSGETQTVVITDTIPQYTTYVDGSVSSGGTYDATTRTITWTFTDVEAWETVTVSFDVTVDQVEQSVIITNQANVVEGDNTYTTDATHNYTDGDEKAVYDAKAAGDAKVSIDGHLVEVNDVLLYEITYNNTTGQAQNVTITDTIPQYTELVENSISRNGAEENGTITWTFTGKDAIPAWGSVTVHFEVVVNGDSDVTVTNQAFINGNNGTNIVTNPVVDDVTDKEVYEDDTEDKDTIIDGEYVTNGQILYYVIDYSNVTGETQDVTITDVIPAYTEYVPASATSNVTGVNGVLSEDGKTLTWTFKNVANNTQLKVMFQVAVAVGEDVNDDDVLIQNHAEILEGTNTHYTDTVTNHTYEEELVKDVFKVEDISISIDGQAVQAGDTLVYTVEYTNLSNEAVDVTITDAIPEYTNYLNGSADNGGTYSETDEKLSWTLNVPAWESVTVSFKVKVDENIPDDVLVNNTAYVGDEPSNTVHNYTGDEDPDKDVFGERADGTTIIDGSEVVDGDILTYTITYTNVTDQDLNSVTITDTIPQYTKLHGSISNGGKHKDGEIIWTFAPVKAWETITVSFQVEVDVENDTEVVITNQAEVKFGENSYKTNEVHNHTDDGDPEKTVSGTTTNDQNEQVAIIDGSEVKVGDVLTYTITYTNLSDEAKKVSITDWIPEYTTFISATEGGALNEKGELVWSFEKVEPWETVTVSFKVKVTTPDVFIDNQATVWDGENKYTNEVTNFTYDEDPVKEVVDADTQINLDGEIVLPGQEMTYAIEYVNTTEQTVSVTIEDALPEHTTLIDGSIIGKGVYADGKITWTFEDVAPRTVINVGFTVSVDADAYGVVVDNTAEVKLNNDTIIETNPVSSRTPAAVTIEGEKIFMDHTGNDKDFDAGDFSFELYQGDTLIETVKNDAEGKFTFQTLTFDNVGAYHYTVKEVKGSQADVIYDTAEYDITVTVSSENDALKAETTVVDEEDKNAEITFTNREKAPEPVYPDPIEVELDVVKELKNYTNQKVDLSKFQFQLYDADNDRVQKVLPANSKGKVTFSLDFDYSDVGDTFHYILSEVDTDISGVTYSTKAYKISIKISESNGKLVAAVWVDGERVDLDEVVFKFINVLRDPSDPWTPKDDNVSPDTGDEGTFLWTALLAVGCVGFLVTLISSFRRKRQRR